VTVRAKKGSKPSHRAKRERPVTTTQTSRTRRGSVQTVAHERGIVVTRTTVTHARRHDTTATTERTRTTTHPKKPQPVRIADDFNQATIDPLTWTVWTNGTGATSQSSNGQLVFTIAANAQVETQYDTVGANDGTQCKFPGDFDARVDYTLLDWPAGNGAALSLTAFQRGPVDWIARATWTPQGDYYNAWPEAAGAPTLDSSGSLRLQRTKGVLSMFFLHDGAWRRLASAALSGQVWVGMTLGTNGDLWQHVAVSAAVDNFVVTAPDAVCPPGTDPRG
jgi:hypothetical protein